MKTRIYFSLSCSIVLLATLSQSPCCAAELGSGHMPMHPSARVSAMHTTIGAAHVDGNGAHTGATTAKVDGSATHAGATATHADGTATHADANATHSHATSNDTWQTLMNKVKQNFHITDEEVEAREQEDEMAKKLHKHLKYHPFPNATTEEVKKGRELLSQSLHIAQHNLRPLDGLKDKQTAYDVMSLVTCVGYINSVDSIALATLFNEYNDGHDAHQQLGFLHRMQIIGKRVDALTHAAANLVATAYGTKNEKIEFKDEFFKSADPLHAFVLELRKNAEQVHKSTLDVDALVLKLEHEASAMHSQ